MKKGTKWKKKKTSTQRNKATQRKTSIFDALSHSNWDWWIMNTEKEKEWWNDWHITEKKPSNEREIERKKKRNYERHNVTDFFFFLLLSQAHIFELWVCVCRWLLLSNISFQFWLIKLNMEHNSCIHKM